MPMENWSDEVVVVHLSNDPQFTEDLESLEHNRKKQPRHVVLNFSAVRYVNSSNISKLLRLRKQMLGEDRRLVLCGLITPVWSTLLVTGLDKIFEFADSVMTALAMMAMDGDMGDGEAEGESEGGAAAESEAAPPPTKGKVPAKPGRKAAKGGKREK